MYNKNSKGNIGKASIKIGIITKQQRKDWGKASI